MKIVAVNCGGDYRTGTLRGLTVTKINAMLNMRPNIVDDPSKVKFSWGFTADGVRCGVWDYKGSYKFKEFSVYGPHATLHQLFGDHYARD